MVQARFDALGPDAKRVLRAAAVFGQTFRPAGVRQLLGGDQDRSLDQWLDILVQKEVLYSRQAADTKELVFRHALLQEAAYDMLTADDRVLGHRLAGAYLEAAGEPEAILLVEHYERGGELQKAAHWCRFAAEQALDANDLGAVIERVERGARLGAEGDGLASMKLTEAQARFWRGDYQCAEAAARLVVDSVSGSPHFDAVRELVSALGQQARFDEVEHWTEHVHSHPADQGEGAREVCLLRAAGYLISGGRFEFAERIIREAELSSNRDEATLGRIHDLRGKLAIVAGKQGVALSRFKHSLEFAEQAGSFRVATEMMANIGFTLCDLGALEEAEKMLNAALARAERMDLGYVKVMVLTNLALVHAYTGKLGDARLAANGARIIASQQGDARLRGVVDSYLSLVALSGGQLSEAERHARDAVVAFQSIPPFQPFGQATLARTLLAQRRIQEALEQIVEANKQMEAQGSTEDGEALVRLTLVECLLAAGQDGEARTALVRAEARLVTRASQIDDETLRQNFLERIPDHRRTIDLARQLQPSN
jgi:tetratricopeptide (TPR) repeat protein